MKILCYFVKLNNKLNNQLNNQKLIGVCFQWFEYIKIHSDKPWRYDIMCSNPNITWDLIETFPESTNMYLQVSTNLKSSTICIF